MPEHDLTDLEQALEQFGATQCTWCTPGVLASARWLFAHQAQPSRADLEGVLDRNNCHCSGYKPILEAMRAAAAARSRKL
jgi:xanthine dehydrogenase iron-sulfur cluster and FAD-binding subunit A